MILQDQCVPAFTKTVVLRIEESSLEFLQIEFLLEELLAADVVGIQMIEIEDAVQFPVLFLYVFLSVSGRRMIGFTDRVAVIVRHGLFVHFLQELVHPRTVHIVLGAFLERLDVVIVLYRIDLAVHVEDVESETVNALLQPEVKDVDDLFPYLGILPVEVSLLDAEQMKIEIIAVAYPFPG